MITIFVKMMEIFEVHITGSKEIIQQLDRLGIKNITIELLNPHMRVIRTEYMSSFVSKNKNLADCQRMVNRLLANLSCEIIRIKIESPYYEHYKKRSLYVESHFKPFDNNYPISRNVESGKEMATDRTYNKKEYKKFIDKWNGEDIEMCLIDTFVDEDKDWFDSYINK